MSEKKTFSKEEVQAALEILHAEYFQQVVALTTFDPKMKDLTYVKVPVTTPDGGTYLVSILHVDGPVLDLRALAKAAEDQEEQNKKPDSV